MSTVGVGTGTTLSIGTQAWSDRLLDIALVGMKRMQIATSSLGTTVLTSNATGFGSETWVAESLTKAGSLKFKIQLDPDNLPKIDESAVNFFVVWPGNATMWSGSGFVTALETSDPLEEIMTGEYQIEISGSVSVFTGLTPVINDASVNVINDDSVLVYGA